MGTDKDRVGDRPHAVAMQAVGLAGDPAGFAVLGCNSAVEALPDMSDGEPPGARKAIGKIKVELRRDPSSANDVDARHPPPTDTLSEPPLSGIETSFAPGRAANAARVASTANHQNGSRGSLPASA